MTEQIWQLVEMVSPALCVTLALVAAWLWFEWRLVSRELAVERARR